MCAGQFVIRGFVVLLRKLFHKTATYKLPLSAALDTKKQSVSAWRNFVIGASLTVNRVSHLCQLILHFGCAYISSLSLQHALHSDQITHSWLRHRQNVRGLRMRSPSHPPSAAPIDSSAECAQPARLRFFRQGRPGLCLHSHPTRLTIRSSRPNIVATATCIRYASTRPSPRCWAA